MHKEDLKAALRKKFGTIRKFEIEAGLSKGSVHEIMRKRRWAKVERAIEGAIGLSSSLSENTDSKRERGTHGLSAEAK